MAADGARRRPINRRRGARGELLILVTAVGAGCSAYAPRQTLIGEYRAGGHHITACHDGRVYQIGTGSDGAAQFLEHIRALDAQPHETLIGEFEGTVTCLYPWDCWQDRQDMFAVEGIVSLQRGQCPPQD
jgi:hypothetical protein